MDGLINRHNLEKRRQGYEIVKAIENVGSERESEYERKS